MIDLKNSKAKNISFKMISCLVISGCFSTQPSQPYSEEIVKKINISELKSNKPEGAKIKIEINNPGFIIKSYSDAILPQTNADVKSFRIFLSKDYNNPFLSGANVLGTGAMIKINKQPVNSVTISNVPSGGPYWAVISAFNETIDNPLAINITKPDITLLSADKMWARSSNSVSVSGAVSNYSDSGTALKVKLFLRNEIPAKIDTSVTLQQGAPAYGHESIDN